MTYIVATDENNKFCIFDGEPVAEKKVARVRGFAGVNSLHMGENVAALLNFGSPPHRIEIQGQARYFKSEDTVKGFEIRDGLGQRQTISTFTFEDQYAAKLMPRLTPDFFVGLCGAMPEPAKPKRSPRPKSPTA